MRQNREDMTLGGVAARIAKGYPVSLAGAVPILAVSGGRDSMVLMHLYARLFVGGHISKRPVVFHLDHRLRRESAEEAELVRRASLELDFPFYLEARDAAAFARRSGRGLEEAGRLLRYRCMQRLARQFDRSYAVTAHHADDYLESLLLHLCRGGGPGALGTLPLISRLDRIVIFRPLMRVTRDWITQTAADEAISYCNDPSNDDEDFRRNRLRHAVVPLLRAEGLGVVQLWDNFHDALDDGDLEAVAPSYLMLDRRMLRGATVSSVKRTLDLALMRLGLSPASRPMSAAVALDFSGPEEKEFFFYRKDVLLWAGSTTPLWLMRNDSPVHERPIVRYQESPTLSADITYAGRVKTVPLAPGDTVGCWSPGLRARLADGTHRKIKEYLQENHLPPLVRARLPLVIGSDGFVKTILFSFWEGLRDRACR